MDMLHSLIIAAALAGLGLAVLLEILRSRNEKRQWRKIRDRLAQAA